MVRLYRSIKKAAGQLPFAALAILCGDVVCADDGRVAISTPDTKTAAAVRLQVPVVVKNLLARAA